jgi:IS66 Orf2 like protein
LVDCCDMRKGFNGLYGLVSSSFGDDPRSGALNVFCNRRHTRIKVLYFDGTADAVIRSASTAQLLIIPIDVMVSLFFGAASVADAPFLDYRNQEE